MEIGFNSSEQGGNILIRLREWMQDLKDELQCMQDDLKQTQKNPNANFIPGAPQEGSAYYQNMTKALVQCLDLTEHGSLKELKDSLGTLLKAAETYCNKREGLVQTSDRDYAYVKERLDAAMTARNILPELIEYLAQLNKILDEDFPDLSEREIGELL